MKYDTDQDYPPVSGRGHRVARPLARGDERPAMNARRERGDLS